MALLPSLVFSIHVQSGAYAIFPDSIKVERKTTPPHVYVLEGLGAAAGVGVTASLTYLMVFKLSRWLEYDEPDMSYAYAVIVSSYIGVPLGAATGTAITGRILNEKGSFDGALIGAIIGRAVGSCLAGTVVGRLLPELSDTPFFGPAIEVVCPIAGAVIVYNRRTSVGNLCSASRQQDNRVHIQCSIAPTLRFETIKGRNQKTIPELGIDLISARF